MQGLLPFSLGFTKTFLLEKKGMYMALKKQWYEIVAPEMFGSKVIGETLAVELTSSVLRVNQLRLKAVLSAVRLVGDNDNITAFGESVVFGAVIFREELLYGRKDDTPGGDFKQRLQVLA